MDSIHIRRTFIQRGPRNQKRLTILVILQSLPHVLQLGYVPNA